MIKVSKTNEWIFWENEDNIIQYILVLYLVKESHKPYFYEGVPQSCLYVRA